MSLDLLGRHVRERAQDASLVGQRQALRRLPGGVVVLRVSELGETEVQELGPASRQHHVAGFQVAVNDVLLVERVERLRDLCGDDQRLIEGNRATFETLGKRLALEKLHDEKGHAVVLSNVVKRADVRVTDSREGLRLTLEAFELRGACTVWRQQDLDGDGAIQPRVARAVHLAHAAGAQRRHDFIWADLRASRQRHEQSFESSRVYFFSTCLSIHSMIRSASCRLLRSCISMWLLPLMPIFGRYIITASPPASLICWT